MALPYGPDTDLENPVVREMVDMMVDEEMQSMNIPLDKYLDHLPAPRLASSVFTEADLERAAAGKRMSALDMSRYELPGPPKSQVNDPEAWKACVHNARAQMQHQLNRIDNLELMVKFGGQAWIRHNEDLASLQAAAQRQLDRVRQQIEALNWQRQNEQVAAGEELQALEVRWGELISKNYEIGAAVAALEAHVEGARTVQQ